MSGELHQQAFDALLARLSPDRSVAAVQYEELRWKLVKFFDWRGATQAEQLADVCLDRLATKVWEGKVEGTTGSYAYGIARMVLLEYSRDRERRAVSMEELAVPLAAPVEEEREDLACFTSCLAKLPEEQRRLIVGYYQEEKIAKVGHRERMAEELGIQVNNLRIRAFRIRATLEACVRGCLSAEGKA